MTAPAKWEFDGEYIQSCNCDYGCPCNFNALPTHGNCEALVAYRITKGHFEGTSLDGITFAFGCWWPSAIHLGNGVGRLYLDPSATPDQRRAIEAIFSGKHGGGIFEIFPRTWREVYPTKVTPIEFHFDAYNSWFKVRDVGEVHSEPIRNAKTNEAFEGTIDLPNGIAFKHAIVSSIRRWWMRDEQLLAVHENRNGHVAHVKFSQAGCIG